MVVDSGTTMSFVPPEVLKAIAAAWEPPLQRNHAMGQYVTPCDAKAPTFSLIIGGKEVRVDGKDTLLRYHPQSKMCFVGIEAAQGFVGGRLNMMGGTIMKSLVAVFDVGAAEMRFANRIRDV
jgi:aspergillopepsin I